MCLRETEGTLVASPGPMLFVSDTDPTVGLICLPEFGDSWTLGAVVTAVCDHEVYLQRAQCCRKDRAKVRPKQLAGHSYQLTSCTIQGCVVRSCFASYKNRSSAQP